jgi:hypothetical protein
MHWKGTRANRKGPIFFPLIALTLSVESRSSKSQGTDRRIHIPDRIE